MPQLPRHYALLLCLAALLGGVVSAVESPTSSGAASQVDTPIVRVPSMKTPPKIDGTMEPKEWEDASALTGFWYDFNAAHFLYLAPTQTQVEVYLGYDKENLYIAFHSPVYPEASWMKARARFPDVIGHPLFGLQWDDHIELELRPYHDATVGYKTGLFKWFFNPTDVYSDQLWTLKAGDGMQWKSNVKARSGVTDKDWVIEMAVPLAQMKTDDYAGKGEDGQDLVKLPPADGTAYRAWFTRGIGGNGAYFNVFDKHVWNVTKTMLVLDSKAVGFQVNRLGPVMENTIDVEVSMKNHNDRSETVRLGFFVESAEGLVYSSYDDAETKDGLVELTPGEVKTLRLKKKFPGISKQGNVLWFDVRSAGSPAKVLFQTRLIEFHDMDFPEFRERRVDVLARLRPPRKDFDFYYNYSPYKNRLSAWVDKGIHGSSEEAKKAVESKLIVLEDNDEEKEVASQTAPFRGDFSTFLIDLPDLKKGSYKVSLLLFDAQKRIVGERSPKPFYKGQFEWEHNKLGLDDVVWAPFTPLAFKDGKFETLKHVYTVAPTGLPEQIYIKAHPQDLPLEKRAPNAKVSEAELVPQGRGSQLRAPLRLEALVNGQAVPAEVVEPAKLVRAWQSELEFASKLKAGPIEIDLTTQYDCDGAMTLKIGYGAAQPAEVDGFELVMDVAGPVDTRSVNQSGGMAPTSGWELTLPGGEGIVWDSAKHAEPMELYYSRFVPYFHFGNGDRGFTWMCDTDQPWILDRDGTTMTLERNKAGEVTWRTKFVNHKSNVQGKRTVECAIFVHPSKPKEAGYRHTQWLAWRPWNGNDGNSVLPNDGPGGIDGSDQAFEFFNKRHSKENPPPRLYILKNLINTGVDCLQKNAYTGEWFITQEHPISTTPRDSKGWYGQPYTRPGEAAGIEVCPSYEDFFVYHLEKQIRVGRIPGWWWDEIFPPYRAQIVATGNAYWRNPEEVKEKELPYQSNFASFHWRNLLKRLSRCFQTHGVTNNTYIWANMATAFESYARDSQLIEGAAAYVGSYDLDNITTYPLSLFRFCAGTNKGLCTKITADTTRHVHPGDNEIHDRAILGRALLHDIGVDLGRQTHVEEFIRTINILSKFGYFENEHTEMVPYWRSSGLVHYGERATNDEFELDKEDPFAKVYITVYRRPLDTTDLKKGFKCLFVVHNESDKAVRSKLYITNPKALFGGPNNLAAGDIRGEYPLPEGADVSVFGDWGSMRSQTPALKDAEDGGLLAKGFSGEHRPIKEEYYGPLYVPAHGFRLIYGHFDPSASGKKK